MTKYAVPNPQFLDALLTIDGVDTYKRTDCRQYLSCLSIAAGAGWDQFHCNDCVVYVALPKKLLRERDNIGDVALLDFEDEIDDDDEIVDDDVAEPASASS